MTTRTIPLETGEAHPRFRVNLSGTVVSVRLNWLERFGYYTVDLFVDESPIATGRGLHPEVDLLENTDIEGRLFLEGAQPNPKNLNVTNKLRYEEPE